MNQSVSFLEIFLFAELQEIEFAIFLWSWT